MNEREADTPQPGRGDEEVIDERLLDEKAEGRKEIVDAATRASEIDRSAPENPENRERSFGVEDPSHSKGSTRRKS